MTSWSSTPKQLLNNCEQWVCESKQHCNTNADQKRSVDQTSQKEHFGLQFVDEFWLTGSALNELAAHEANAQTGS
jgi:hypothetical protein